MRIKELSDGSVSRLKLLADAEGWEQIVHDCRDEQQVRMPDRRE
jgi:hypothetical protein